MVIAIDISEKKRLQEEMEITSYNVERKERERMAINLRNGLQQMLLASYMNLEVLGNRIDGKLDAKSISIYKKGLTLLNEAIETTRKIAHEITPFEIEEKGLLEGIETIIRRQEPSGLSFTLIYDLKKRLPTNIEIILFRSIQELINNTVKYSEAKNAEIVVSKKDNEVIVNIRDDGKGFNPKSVRKKGIGLKSLNTSIHSISGKLRIESQPGNGTRVKIRVPLPF